LISVEELNEMIAYLERHDYAGNYYLQFFRNNVETLAELPYSIKINATGIKACPTIDVVFRD